MDIDPMEPMAPMDMLMGNGPMLPPKPLRSHIAPAALGETDIIRETAVYQQANKYGQESRVYHAER